MMITTRKGSEVQVDSVLVLSTGHVAENTNHALLHDTEDDLPTALVWPYGYMVYVDCDAMGLDRFPELRTVLEFARVHDCAWVRFDCDAPLIPELQTFTW